MARVALVALALAAFLLASCSRQTLLIVTDQYWKASTLDGSRMSRGLKHLSETRAVRVNTKVVDYGSSLMEKLVGVVEGTSGSYVLLSPLYSYYAPALAAHFGDRRFIAFSRPPSPPRPSNISYLVSDPGGAFSAAAKRISKHLAATGQSARQSNQEIVGVFSDSASGQQALAAFRRGLDSASSQASLSVIQVRGSADRSRLRSFVESSRGKGVGAYLLAAPSLDAYALNLLQNSTVPIVTLDWRYGATYSDKVLFSIDEDIPAALMKLLEPMGRPADKEIRIPWDIVAGAKGS